MVKNEDYVLRITNASPVELVIITYDILLENIEQAINAHRENPAVFIEGVNGARDALVELIGALDRTNPVANEIYPIYEYVNGLLLGALIYEKKSGLEDAVRVLTPLRESWVKVSETEPKDGAVYKNAPKVYTGLTYGRKGSNNDYVENPSKGIKA